VLFVLRQSAARSVRQARRSPRRLQGVRCTLKHSRRRNLVLFLVDSSYSCIPARQWTDICNTRCSILSRFSLFHVSHFPPLQHGAAFSCPAISCLAFSASPNNLVIYVTYFHLLVQRLQPVWQWQLCYSAAANHYQYLILLTSYCCHWVRRI